MMIDFFMYVLVNYEKMIFQMGRALPCQNFKCKNSGVCYQHWWHTSRLGLNWAEQAQAFISIGQN